MMGHADFAHRSLEFFIKRYNKAGYLTTGYTMIGTGEHLWTLAEHWQRTHDRAWVEKIAPEVARVCRWIVSQRAKTKRLDARGRKVPEYGLMPPGVAADWNRYAYRFFCDAQYCAGLEAAGRMLADIGEPSASALLKDADDYREDLLRAYRWTQARSPVVRLDDGTWMPDGPAMLACFGRVDDFLPGEDGNRSWCYGVEIGAHHLAATRILDPAAADVRWNAEYLEDVQFLRSGMGDYPEAKNRTDPFCFGGFSKVQPYYCRIAEVYALRDDVKPFVRAYFNAIPALLSRENLSFWEHFHNMGGWNKTHETGWFLCQTRVMLVAERGRESVAGPHGDQSLAERRNESFGPRRADPVRQGELHDPLRRRSGRDRSDDPTAGTRTARADRHPLAASGREADSLGYGAGQTAQRLQSAERRDFPHAIRWAHRDTGTVLRRLLQHFANGSPQRHRPDQS